MDRAIVYVDQNPLDTDLLNTNKNTMIALGLALKAILGTSTIVDGLACTPTGPASMQVLVAPGSIMALENVDGTAYGSLAADTTHQIVKQGIVLNTTTLSCPAPSTTGFSINYLIQVAYQDTDAGSVVLPYFNSSNPDVAYNGPNNTGVSQNTVREGQCLVAVKSGIAAATGTQVTPTPDAGYIGLSVVTVANGAVSITSGNISLYSGSSSATGSTASWSTPFITEKLNDKISIPTGDARYVRISGGSGGVRTLLTTTTNFYVNSSTGNDSTGTGAIGAPWQTLQHAANVILATIDIGLQTCSVNFAGTDLGGLTIAAPFVGGMVNFIGNTGSPSSAAISPTANNGVTIICPAQITMAGFKITGTATAASGVEVRSGGNLSFNGNMEFGAATLSQIDAQLEGIITLGANITFSGSAAQGISSQVGGRIQVGGTPTFTMTGTPNYGNAFAVATDVGAMQVGGITFSGAATGVRYSVAGNAVIDTNGGGATYFPGNAGGTTATGGQYV